MKQTKRILSLVLASVILLMYLVPVGSVQATADEYIAASYASNITVKTDRSTELYDAPTNSAAVAYSLSAGTNLKVTALKRNTSGEYWYEVRYSGTTVYVAAADTRFNTHITNDVNCSEACSPACLGLGEAFSIGGTIHASLNDLDTITVAMSANSATALSASDTADGKSYTLDGSVIASNMAFESLPEGDYSYTVTAEAISYYIDGSGTLTKVSTPVVVEKKACIINGAVTSENATAFGVDVGYPQGTIDWSLVSQEVDFTIIRIGWKDHIDAQFHNNVSGCETYGVPYGYYIYSYAESISEAIAEAEWVLETIASTNPTLPIYFDYEDTRYLTNVPSKKDVCKAFCDTILDAGYQPGIYSTEAWFNEELTDPYFATLPKWICEPDVNSPNYHNGIRMWQYSWAGAISGIDTDVSCNYYFGRLPSTMDTPSCTEHTWVYKFENQIHTFTCSECGKVVTGAGTDGKKFSITGAAPVIEDSIVMNYKVRLPEGFTDFYMSFDFNGETYYIYESTYDEVAERYVFAFDQVLPQFMGENIRATVYATFQGQTVAIYHDNYSMKQYTINTLKKATDEKVIRVLSDLMVYGEKAQIYLNHKTDALVTNGLTLSPSTFVDVPADCDKQAMGGTADGVVKIKGATIVMLSKLTLRVTIEVADPSAYTYRVTTSTGVYEYTEFDLEPTGTANQYYVYFDELMATEFNEVVKLSFVQDGAEVSRYLEYSVNTYICKNYTKATGDLLELIKAIYNYGEAARAYAGR